MDRRRRAHGNIADGLFDCLLMLPWWGGLVFAPIAYAFLGWVIPFLFRKNYAETVLSPIPLEIGAKLSETMAPFAALLVVIMGLAAIAKRWLDRRLLDGQTGLESIRQLNWHAFENLLAEAFRREGYDVEHTGGRGPDGGVDLRLRRGEALTLVQCKHWKTNKVGVKVVRELLGVAVSESADEAIVVTSGAFTKEAESFAHGTSVRLIGGEALLQMIREVQRSKQTQASAGAQVRKAGAPACPQCGRQMMLRTAKQGAHAGKAFWGCGGYPECRGIRQTETHDN